MIPLLIVSDDKQEKELTDLANDVGDLGQSLDILPILTNSSEEAKEVYLENPYMMLAILNSNGQETYDMMREMGYRHSFIVASSKNINKQSWNNKDVTFLKLDDDDQEVYKQIEQVLLY